MVAISTFTYPLKATHVGDQLPRFVIAIGQDDTGLYLVAIDGDGELGSLSLNEVVIDWRYDPATQLWGDPTTGQIDNPFGEDDDD